MAKRTPIANDILNTPVSGTHPLISAMQLAQSTKEFGGGSMNVRTGELAQPGENKFLVGGERSKEGKRIGTAYLNRGQKDPQLSVSDVLKQKQRIETKVDPKEWDRTYVGTWRDDDELHKGVQVDATGDYPTKEAAVETAKKRNEKSAFAMKDLETIDNPTYDPKKGRK